MVLRDNSDTAEREAELRTYGLLWRVTAMWQCSARLRVTTCLLQPQQLPSTTRLSSRRTRSKSHPNSPTPFHFSFFLGMSKMEQASSSARFCRSVQGRCDKRTPVGAICYNSSGEILFCFSRTNAHSSLSKRCRVKCPAAESRQ